MLHDYEIAYTFGFEPLQQYLIAFPGPPFTDSLSLTATDYEARIKGRASPSARRRADGKAVSRFTKHPGRSWDLAPARAP
jgi:hypothetical protein